MSLLSFKTLSLLVVAATLFLAGCATAPVAPARAVPPPATAVKPSAPVTPSTPAVAKPVPAPVPAAAFVFPADPDYKTLVKAFLKRSIKDPDSAIYDNWSIAKAYLDGTPPIYGWQVFVSVNSKDLRGKYTGVKTYTFWINGERVENALFLGGKLHPFDPAATNVKK